jgi:hypothetical protein
MNCLVRLWKKGDVPPPKARKKLQRKQALELIKKKDESVWEEINSYNLKPKIFNCTKPEMIVGLVS